MNRINNNDKHIIASLVRDHLLDRVLEEVIEDIALEIVGTEDDQQGYREHLYLLTKAIKETKGKLQEYTNDIEFQEE